MHRREATKSALRSARTAGCASPMKLLFAVPLRHVGHVRVEIEVLAEKAIVKFHLAVLRLRIGAHVEAGHRRGKTAEGVVDILCDLTQQFDEVRTVALDTSLDARAIAVRPGPLGIECA